MLWPPQGPRHSAQGDQGNQAQFTEKGPRVRGRSRGGCLAGWDPSVRAKGETSRAQSGLGRQLPGCPSWQMQSW